MRDTGRKDNGKQERRPGPWLGRASLVSAALVAGVMVLERWPGEQAWPTALLTYLPQWPLLALPTLVVIWALLAWRVWALLFNAAVWLVALVGLAGLEVPGMGVGGGEGQVLRVATWNLHHWHGDLPRLRKRILSWNCDVVCLQEVGEAAFAGLLPGYAEAAAGDVRTFVRGSLLLTEEIQTGKPPMRPALACEAQVEGESLRVVNVHFRVSEGYESLRERLRSLRSYMRNTVQTRGAQYNRVLSWLPSDLPVVVAGDFNTPPNSMFSRRMSRRLTDAFRERGLGVGYTYLARGIGVLRIDYVWTGNGAEPTACWIERAAPSDHRPVIARVRLYRAPEVAGRTTAN